MVNGKPFEAENAMASMLKEFLRVYVKLSIERRVSHMSHHC